MPHNTTAIDTVPDPGALPRWALSELPAPPPYNVRNLMRVIGPGAILLATSIGGGEWLVGPAVGVRYGTSVMWIATIAIVLQLVFNLEGIRYTLYTGEPIYAGFNIAGFVLAFAGGQILVVNRRFLPPALRPPLWREVLLGLCVLFYAFFTLRLVVSWF